MARLGLALDLGTTNICGFIIDFDKPQDHFTQSLKNSQNIHGLDTITRLTYLASAHGSAKKLQQLIVNDINNIIFVLCKKIRINRKRISKIIVSGNNFVIHTLLGFDTSKFSSYPYESKLKDSVSIEAHEIGIVASKKSILITLPVISAYVGSDVVAGIIYANMDQISSCKFLIDLGTNAEIVFGNKEMLYAASAAAGPAFRSRNIPLGSKMISKIAQMLREGHIDKTGRLVTVDDIRALQLAKGAIRAAIQILLEKSNRRIDDVRKILISGLFGEKINRDDAIQIGLVPKVNKNLIRSIGNSSLGGAKQILLNEKLLDRAHEIAHKTQHIELSLESDYQKKFLENLDF